METKTCTQCGAVKPRSEFHKKADGKDGLRADCKICACKKSRLDYAANLEKRREEKRHRYAENPEKFRKENQLRYAANPEKYIECSKRWQKNNPEKTRKTKRRWRKNNPEKNCEYNRLWYKNHPEWARDSTNRRRARKAGAEGSHTHQELEWLIAFQGLKCLYCDVDLMTVEWAFDHITALDKGGSNYIQNICLACKSCNSSKGTKSVVDFMGW